MAISKSVQKLLDHLATRPGHDEVKSGFQQLLIEEFGAEREALRFEQPVPEVRGRLDALIGRTVFEAKRNLDREWSDVIRRMPDYLADRERAEKEKFVGIASDGLKWVVLELSNGELVEVKSITLDPERPGYFLAWLDGAIALKASLPPDALTIQAELGRESVAYRRVDTALRALWDDAKSDPAMSLKRQLWADMLKLVYGQDTNKDALWFQHTFLVIVAKCIALSVLDLKEDDPARMLSGDAFADAGIEGAVESDFFDWVLAKPEGVALVRRIMTHVRRFRLGQVQIDVLKILYESLIDRDERHSLGEYYTPDWLASKMVKHAVDRPLEQRVLDPACGSGTFLFQAIRHFLREAEDAGLDPSQRAREICAHVAGMDIHPVAVIIARVTYLLGLAPTLAKRSGTLSVPVYLGDALQLSTSHFLTKTELTIRVPPPAAGDGQSGETDENGREQLDFPETFCRDPALFDKAIERMRSGAIEGLSRQQIEHALFRITEQHYRADVTREQQEAISDLGKTYVTLARLREEGRDTIWTYVVRNLSRPLFLSAAGGWAHVLIGNPPWVAFRFMATDLRNRFQELATKEGIYVTLTPSHNDLCALFLVRAGNLYLRSSGKIAQVLPLAALTRNQFGPLRGGSYLSYCIAWDHVWTMDETVQPLFPVPSCVLFGRKRANAAQVPKTVRSYSGSLPHRDSSEEDADRFLHVDENAPAPVTAQTEGGSRYRKMFRQGAILVPRVLALVNRRQSGVLGSNPSMPSVESRRSANEKRPWKNVEGIVGRVESEFVRPVLLGESIAPFRILREVEGVIPVNTLGGVLDAKRAADRGYSGLYGWMSKAEKIFDQHTPSTRTFHEQLNYIGQLSSQFPIAPLRVVYAKAGTQPAACIIRSEEAVIDHMLYWSAVSTEEEGAYLCGLFNSETIRSRVEKYQSRGLFGARHFDKVMFNLPIPLFDGSIQLHADLAGEGAEAERVAALVELPEDVRFQRARKLIRNALSENGVAGRIDALVERLLDGR